MSGISQAVHPVQVLREQVTALEAAITLALADPDKHAVHQLRTSSRRIEAQLTLLDLLLEEPGNARPGDGAGREVRNLLRELRHAAGEVRDLDVQRDLLQNLAKRSIQPHSTVSLPGLSKDLPKAARDNRHLSHDIRDLRRTLKHRRGTLAAALVHLLKRHPSRLARELEHLLASLEAKEQEGSLSLQPARLSSLARCWYRSRLPEPSKPKASTGELHGIRKSAKLARYMTETTPATGPLAETFEHLQQSGGTWHDYLQLRETARDELGRHAALTGRLTELTRSSLESYRKELAEPVPDTPFPAQPARSPKPARKRA